MIYIINYKVGGGGSISIFKSPDENGQILIPKQYFGVFLRKVSRRGEKLILKN